nr:MAG TPA: hypothetical protein [Caudoviricetes sp.]
MREILHCLNILLFIIFYKKSSKSLTYSSSRSLILYNNLRSFFNILIPLFALITASSETLL